MAVKWRAWAVFHRPFSWVLRVGLLLGCRSGGSDPESCEAGDPSCTNADAPVLLQNSLCLKLVVPSKLPPLGPPHTGKRKARACIGVRPTPLPTDPDLDAAALDLAATFGLGAAHTIWGVQEVVGGPVLPFSMAIGLSVARAGTGDPPPEFKLVLHTRRPRSVASGSDRSLFDHVPVIDFATIASGGGNAAKSAGKGLVRALREVGWARVRVGSTVVQHHALATRLGAQALTLLAKQPELQKRGLIRCPQTGKITGVEPRGRDTTYLHVRRMHARGGTFTDGHGKAREDDGVPEVPTKLPYAGVPGLPDGLQPALDTLYDDLNAVAAALLHTIARGLGLNGHDATSFADSIVAPDATFHQHDPLSDSYFRLFRYAGGPNQRCFGEAHSDVGGVTVAPLGAVAGLELLLVAPSQSAGELVDGGDKPRIERWQWVGVEALAHGRVVNGTGTSDEWVVFAGEALARAAGLHPVVHRVCLGPDGPPSERISAPFFQRPGAFAEIVDARKRKKSPGNRGEILMREFFQTLKKRLYNTVSLSNLSP